MTTNCRGCGREIVWAMTSHGRAVPLDPKALVFSVMHQDGKLVAVKPSGGPAGERFMVSHIATCPNAAEFSARSIKAENTPVDYNEPKDIS